MSSILLFIPFVLLVGARRIFFRLFAVSSRVYYFEKNHQFDEKRLIIGHVQRFYLKDEHQKKVLLKEMEFSFALLRS